MLVIGRHAHNSEEWWLSEREVILIQFKNQKQYLKPNKLRPINIEAKVCIVTDNHNDETQ